jgi:LPS sulfotransferase NodH
MFFIVGRGRSGSTLLSRMLDGHPEVVVAPEGLFVMHLDRAYGRRPPDGRWVRAFQRDLRLEDRMKRWALDPVRLARSLEAVGPDAGYEELCSRVYAEHAAACGKPQARLLGDQNPHHALFVERLMELFPTARFVWLVRDHRDNILSYRDVPFDLGSVAGLAYRWRRYNESVARAARAAPARFKRLRFEDLLANPEATLECLCDFLALDFDARMLEFQVRAGESALEWHRRLSQPLDTRRANRWRQGMTARQVSTADAICQPFAADLGYPPAHAAEKKAAVARLPGVAGGWAITELELLLFRLPLATRTACIRCYRSLTGNIIR